MESSIDPHKIARNVWRDTLQDGLTELSIGLGMLFMAALLPSETTGFVIIPAIIGPVVVKRLKERYTYPRLGYVDLPERSKNPGLFMLASLGVAILVIVVLIFITNGFNKAWGWNKWLPLLPAFLFQGAFIPLGVKSGIKRYYWIAMLSLVLGVVCTLPTLPGRVDNLSLFLGGIGTILAIWGAVLLIVFLRTYPVQLREAQDGE